MSLPELLMTLPTSCKSSSCELSIFEGSGQMTVACHSEAAPSPGGFSRARASDGKGGSLLSPSKSFAIPYVSSFYQHLIPRLFCEHT